MHFLLKRNITIFVNRIAPSWNTIPSNVIISFSLDGFKLPFLIDKKILPEINLFDDNYFLSVIKIQMVDKFFLKIPIKAYAYGNQIICFMK